MGTTVATTVEQATKVEPKPAKRPRRTTSVGFSGPEGATLRIAVKIAKDGTAKTWVSHRPGKKAKSVRGASEQHANLAAAEKAMEKLIAQAVKLGWEKRVRIGFVAKPDAFTEIPKPKGKK